MMMLDKNISQRPLRFDSLKTVIIGLAVGFSGLLWLWVVGLTAALDLARPLEHCLNWLALPVVLAGMWIFSLHSGRVRNDFWLRTGRWLRATLVPAALVYSYVFALTMEWFDLRAQPEWSEVMVALFLPALLLPPLFLAAMLIWLSDCFMAPRLAWQLRIVQWLWCGLWLISLVVVTVWLIGLTGYVYWDQALLLSWSYGVAAAFESVAHLLLLVLVPWLMALGLVLVDRIGWVYGDAVPIPEVSLPRKMLGGNTCASRIKLWGILATLFLAGALFWFYVIEVRRARNLASRSAENYLAGSASAVELDALGEGLGRGLLPSELGNRVLEKSVTAEISPNYDRRTPRGLVNYAIEYPNALEISAFFPAQASAYPRLLAWRVDERSAVSWVRHGWDYYAEQTGWSTPENGGGRANPAESTLPPSSPKDIHSVWGELGADSVRVGVRHTIELWLNDAEKQEPPAYWAEATVLTDLTFDSPDGDD